MQLWTSSVCWFQGVRLTFTQWHSCLNFSDIHKRISVTLAHVHVRLHVAREIIAIFKMRCGIICFALRHSAMAGSNSLFKILNWCIEPWDYVFFTVLFYRCQPHFKGDNTKWIFEFWYILLWQSTAFSNAKIGHESSIIIQTSALLAVTQIANPLWHAKVDICWCPHPQLLQAKLLYGRLVLNILVWV